MGTLHDMNEGQPSRRLASLGQPALPPRPKPQDHARARVPVRRQSMMPARGTHACLGDLNTIRPTDTAAEHAARDRHAGRISVEPIHAITIMLVLVVALAACLTMLVQQGINYGQAGASYTADSVQSETSQPQARQQDTPAPDTGSSSAAQSIAPSPSATPADPQSALIDINTASAEQLQSVSGIGPVTAQRIIDYRNQVGRFTSVDDLLNVRGIGVKTLANIRPSLCVR